MQSKTEFVAGQLRSWLNVLHLDYAYGSKYADLEHVDAVLGNALSELDDRYGHISRGHATIVRNIPTAYNCIRRTLCPDDWQRFIDILDNVKRFGTLVPKYYYDAHTAYRDFFPLPREEHRVKRAVELFEALCCH